MATIAEILKSRITKSGISKTYVASKLDVTEKTIENYMRGIREPDATTLVKLSQILEFSLNELSEQNVPPPQKEKRPPTNAYVTLLESNDQFFKREYAQLLISLNKLIDLGKRSEALIKLNLEHIGNVEAIQKGVSPEEIHEQINNQIVEMGPSEQMGNDGDK